MRVFFLMLFCFPLIGFSQKHLISIEAGPSISIAFAAPVLGAGWDDEYNSKVGFYSGLSYTYQFSKHIGIKGNVGFEMKGYDLYMYGSDTSGTKYRVHDKAYDFDYVIFSPQMRFAFGERISFTADIGPYIGGLVNMPSHTSRVDFGFDVTPGLKINIGQRFSIALLIKNSIGIIGGKGAGMSGSYYQPHNFSSSFNIGLYYRL